MLKQRIWLIKNGAYRPNNLPHRVGGGLLLLTFGMAALPAARAQGNLELHLAPVNRIGAGYNVSTHTYDQDFIRNNLIDPKDRPVQADVCSFLSSRKIRMDSTEDGGRCADQTVPTLPAGVSAVVLTLTGPHPLLNKTVDLQEFRISKENYVGSGTCIPSAPVQWVPQCSFTFSVPLPSNMVVNAPPEHSIKAEVVGSGGQILLTKAKAVAVPRRVPLIVSVGESLASGEGNPHSVGRSRRRIQDPTSQSDCFDDTTVMIKFELKPDMISQPTWYEPRDHRSLNSGPAQAARSLLNQWPYVVFLSFAKSGAKISDIVDQLSHVKEVVGDHKIDALLISAGGNDVGFSNVLKDMARDFRGSDGERVLSKFLERILVLRNKEYPKLNQAMVDLNLNVGEVLINEYPGKLFNRLDGEPAKGCGVFRSFAFWSVSKRDAVALNRMGDFLNGEVKLLADKHGWRFVFGISSEFAKHGYCSPESFYRSAEHSCDQQGDFDGTMHPNRDGTAVYARALARELRKVLPKPERPVVK